MVIKWKRSDSNKLVEFKRLPNGYTELREHEHKTETVFELRTDLGLTLKSIGINAPREFVKQILLTPINETVTVQIPPVIWMLLIMFDAQHRYFMSGDRDGAMRQYLAGEKALTESKHPLIAFSESGWIKESVLLHSITPEQLADLEQERLVERRENPVTHGPSYVAYRRTPDGIARLGRLRYKA